MCYKEDCSNSSVGNIASSWHHYWSQDWLKSGFGFFEQIQWSWKLEIVSTSEKKEWKSSSCLCNGSPKDRYAFFLLFLRTTNQVTLKQRSWHHQWSHLSLLDLNSHFSTLCFFFLFPQDWYTDQSGLCKASQKRENLPCWEGSPSSQSFVTRRRNSVCMTVCMCVCCSEMWTGGWVYILRSPFLIGVL